MSLEFFMILFILTYFAVLAFIGYSSSRTKAPDDYFIASRNVGYISLISTVGASFRDGVGVVFWIGTGLTFGYGGLWLIFGMMTSLFLVAFLGSKLRERAAREGYITISEILSDHLGMVSEFTVSIVILIFSAIYSSIQFFVISNLFQEIFSISAQISTFISLIVIAIYILPGGYKSVVRTDVFQLILILGLAFVPFYLKPSPDDFLNFSTLNSLGSLNSFGLFGIGFFSIFSGAEVWQRVISCRNKKIIRLGFSFSGLAIFIMTVMLILIGFGSKNILGSDIDANQVLFLLFTSKHLPPAILAYIGVAVTAASMSTLDTFTYLFSSTFMRNIYPRKKITLISSYIRMSRFVSITFLVMAAIMSLYITDIIKLLFDASSFLFIMAPVFLLAIAGLVEFSRKLDILLSLSMLVSAILYVYLFVEGYFSNLAVNLVPVAICAVLSCVSLLYCKWS